MLKSMRKEHPAPYPGHPPIQLLVNQENSVLRETTLKNVLIFFFFLGFFHCHGHNPRSTRVISASASDLAIAHTRKHFILWPQATLTNCEHIAP